MKSWKVGHALIMLGLVLLIVGFALLALAPLLDIGEQGSTGGVGVCVAIFVIPVCVGYGDASLPVFLSLASVLLLVIVLLPLLLSFFQDRGDRPLENPL